MSARDKTTSASLLQWFTLSSWPHAEGLTQADGDCTFNSHELCLWQTQSFAWVSKVLASCYIPCAISRTALGSGCSLLQEEGFHQSKLSIKINSWKKSQTSQRFVELFIFFFTFAIIKVSPLWKELIPFEIEIFHESPVSSPSSLTANPVLLPALTQSHGVSSSAEALYGTSCGWA